MVGVQRYSDAGVDLHGYLVEVERCEQGLDQVAGLGTNGREIHPVCEQDGELVAAGADEQILGSQRFRQPPCDVTQQFVADVATEGVINLLELVQGQQKQPLPGRARSVRFGAAVVERYGCQRGGQCPAVGQPGQVVGHGLLVAFGHRTDVSQRHRKADRDDRHGSLQPAPPPRGNHSRGSTPPVRQRCRPPTEPTTRGRVSNGTPRPLTATSWHLATSSDATNQNVSIQVPSI